jgi:hypothetical protein
MFICGLNKIHISLKKLHSITSLYNVGWNTQWTDYWSIFLWCVCDWCKLSAAAVLLGLLDSVILQDGAPAHYAADVRGLLNNQFPLQTGWHGHHLSSPSGPDLTTCNNWLWSFVREQLSTIHMYCHQVKSWNSPYLYHHHISNALTRLTVHLATNAIVLTLKITIPIRQLSVKWWHPLIP